MYTVGAVTEDSEAQTTPNIGANARNLSSSIERA